MSAPRLARISSFRLVTNDLARLTAFYCEKLGFARDGEAAPIGAREMAALGLSGRGLRQCLRIGRQSVALDQFDEPGEPYPADGDAASPWFQHLALVVEAMGQAYGRLREVVPISQGGPQRLPRSSGGVTAFKFRDPDGHPLELLQFPAGGAPAAWRGASLAPGAMALGIDHSAVSVRDAEASLAFYAALGLRLGEESENKGLAQERLDGMAGVDVRVAPLLPPEQATPHLELLGYRRPHPAAAALWAPNAVAATRVVWRGAAEGLMRDPDGHWHQIEAGESR